MSRVQLYVYDLSNGLAKQLSRQLTGRQIDGIWCANTQRMLCCDTYHGCVKDRHTSIVVFGKEVFYGQGIAITKPGQSHVCGFGFAGIHERSDPFSLDNPYK